MRDPHRAAWSEGDSGIYRDIAPVAVPERVEMLAALVCLVPFDPGEPFRAVELGCGDGALAAVLLECYPNASLTALDRSDEMRAAAGRRLRRFANRGRVEDFELAAPDWHSWLRGADCVLSSLVLHHLPPAQKRALYGDIGRRISRRGALLVADIVEPLVPGARELFAATWDLTAERQSRSVDAGSRLIDRFHAARWNHYRYPDPADTPSGLFEQLEWMREGGFSVVDCFWMRAGHAVYGGYKSAPADRSHLRFDVALECARRVVDEPM